MDLKDLFILQEYKNKGDNIYELLSASFQGVKRLFVLAYVIEASAANNEAGIKNNKKVFSSKRNN